MSDAAELTAKSFRRCETCGGMGFLRKGEFVERTYPRCTDCGGLGQVYLLQPKE